METSYLRMFAFGLGNINNLPLKQLPAIYSSAVWRNVEPTDKSEDEDNDHQQIVPWSAESCSLPTECKIPIKSDMAAVE